MKIKSIMVIVMVGMLMSFPDLAFPSDIPRLQGHVNDYGKVLLPEEIKNLEAKLAKEDNETSNQIVVLTITSLNGEDDKDYAQKVFDSWKLGQKGKDNGVLLLQAKKEKKIRIHTGYGLEGSLPDGRCGEIIRTVMAPNFKRGKYYEGFDKACDKIILAIKGEYKSSGVNDGKLVLFFFAMLILFFLSAAFGLIHYSLGGIVGGAGAFCAVVYWIGTGLVYGFVATIVGIFIGMVAKQILEALSEGGSGGLGFGGSSGGGHFSGGGGGSGGGGASGNY